VTESSDVEARADGRNAGIWGEARVIPLSQIIVAESGPPRALEPRGAGTDPVAIIWTSGTTGTAKGAWFDHRNMAAAVAAAGAMTAPFDRRISAIPMVHAGYMAKLWEQLAMGVAIVLSPTPWSAESMLEVLINERISVAGGVPTQWAKLVELPGIGTADLTSLRIGLVATAPAPPELVLRVVETIGCPLVVRYAMTECPSITGTEPADEPELQYRTVGRTQAGMTIELVDEEGAPVAPDSVGRIRVAGPCVMRGYWNDASKTAEVLTEDGLLTTSDLGRFDASGHLVLAGRVDDMYIRGGYNVYPIEVEAVLSEHPEIAQAAVVGLPAEVIGEIGVAFIVMRDPHVRLGLESLRDWVGARLADYKRPDRIEYVEALPLTAMLKVDKKALQRSLA
jgi:acyl-CoA synthetase (AMP-forming)/AMP-acid ligase II